LGRLGVRRDCRPPVGEAWSGGRGANPDRYARLPRSTRLPRYDKDGWAGESREPGGVLVLWVVTFSSKNLDAKVLLFFVLVFLHHFSKKVVGIHRLVQRQG